MPIACKDFRELVLEWHRRNFGQEINLASGFPALDAAGLAVLGFTLAGCATLVVRRRQR